MCGLSEGIGWCGGEEGGWKLRVKVKEGVMEEGLVERMGWCGMSE